MSSDEGTPEKAEKPEKAKSGKPKGMWTPQIVRERMRAAALVRRLQKFALGEKDDQGLEIKMTTAQVTATLGLLRKCVPDLASVEFSGQVTHRHVQELSDAELTHIAAGGSAGVAEAAAGTAIDPSLH